MSYDDDTKRIVRLHDRIKDLEQKLADAAAFLDALADAIDGPFGPPSVTAADCRAMAEKLRK